MKRKELLSGLEHFGLKETEAILYLSALECGETLVAPLAKVSGIPRTTTYSILEDLGDRNLFTIINRGKRTFYRATSPKQILKDVLDKEALIRNMLPHLEALTEKQVIIQENSPDFKTPLPFD